MLDIAKIIIVLVISTLIARMGYLQFFPANDVIRKKDFLNNYAKGIVEDLEFLCEEYSPDIAKGIFEE